MKVGRADQTTVSQAAALPVFFFCFLCTKQPAAVPEAALRRLKFVYQTALAQPLLRGSSRRRECQREGAQSGAKPSGLDPGSDCRRWDPLKRLS